MRDFDSIIEKTKNIMLKGCFFKLFAPSLRVNNGEGRTNRTINVNK